MFFKKDKLLHLTLCLGMVCTYLPNYALATDLQPEPEPIDLPYYTESVLSDYENYVGSENYYFAVNDSLGADATDYCNHLIDVAGTENLPDASLTMNELLFGNGDILLKHYLTYFGEHIKESVEYYLEDTFRGSDEESEAQFSLEATYNQFSVLRPFDDDYLDSLVSLGNEYLMSAGLDYETAWQEWNYEACQQTVDELKYVYAVLYQSALPKEPIIQGYSLSELSEYAIAALNGYCTAENYEYPNFLVYPDSDAGDISATIRANAISLKSFFIRDSDDSYIEKNMDFLKHLTALRDIGISALPVICGQSEFKNQINIFTDIPDDNLDSDYETPENEPEYPTDEYDYENEDVASYSQDELDAIQYTLDAPPGFLSEAFSFQLVLQMRKEATSYIDKICQFQAEMDLGTAWEEGSPEDEQKAYALAIYDARLDQVYASRRFFTEPDGEIVTPLLVDKEWFMFDCTDADTIYVYYDNEPIAILSNEEESVYVDYYPNFFAVKTISGTVLKVGLYPESFVFIEPRPSDENIPPVDFQSEVIDGEENIDTEQAFDDTSINENNDLTPENEVSNTPDNTATETQTKDTDKNKDKDKDNNNGNVAPDSTTETETEQQEVVDEEKNEPQKEEKKEPANSIGHVVHMYELSFQWKKDHTCDVTATCLVCGEKITSIPTDVVSSENDDGTLYTATAHFDGNDYTSTKFVEKETQEEIIENEIQTVRVVRWMSILVWGGIGIPSIGLVGWMLIRTTKQNNVDIGKAIADFLKLKKK